MASLVVILDQRDSRGAGSDHVPALIAEIGARLRTRAPLFRDPAQPVLAFERTVGDEVQGVLAVDEPSCLLTLPAVLEAASRSGQWWIGLGVGAAELGKTASASTGPAFFAAREAVELAKKPASAEFGACIGWGISNRFVDKSLHQSFRALQSAGPTGALGGLASLTNGPRATDLWAAWRVASGALAAYASLLESQSPAGKEAIDAVRQARSQSGAAEILQISQQAMSLRLSAARWRTETQLSDALGLSLLGLGQAIAAFDRADANSVQKA